MGIGEEPFTEFNPDIIYGDTNYSDYSYDSSKDSFFFDSSQYINTPTGDYNTWDTSCNSQMNDGYSLNNSVNFDGLFEQSDLIGVGIVVIITTLKVSSIIVSPIPQLLSITSTLLGITCPSNIADEDLMLRRYLYAQETIETQRRILELQKWIEPMLKKFFIDYEWESNFIYDEHNNVIPYSEK